MRTATLLRESRERARMTQGELAARAGTTQPAVSRYEAGLVSPSVATLDRLLAATGTQLTLGAEPAARSMDARTPRMTLLRSHRGAILAAARRHGASNVRVFGSVVRGTDTDRSDVDLLVDLDVRGVGLFPLDDLRTELEDLLDERVDVVAEQILAPHVAATALVEAVPL